MKVLLIEDSPKTVRFVAEGLAQSGFVVDTATTAAEGIGLAMARPQDALIVDVGLPDRDGFSVLEEIRQRGNQTPALYLTARGTIEDRVRGLEIGADDYLVKPFAISELVARLRAITRRGVVVQPDVLVVGDLEIDRKRHRATRAGVDLKLTPKEFALLWLLARNRGDVLTRSTIAERVWAMNHVSETNVVDVHIRRLRAKVDDPFERPLIRTIRGVGYVVDAERDA